MEEAVQFPLNFLRPKGSGEKHTELTVRSYMVYIPEALTVEKDYRELAFM